MNNKKRFHSPLSPLHEEGSLASRGGGRKLLNTFFVQLKNCWDPDPFRIRIPILLLLLLFIPLSASALSVTISRGEGEAGLIGHWELSEESENKGANLVLNSGFEDGITSWGTQGFSVTSDSSVYKTGSKSYRIYKTSWDWGAIYQTIPNASDYVGKTITYSVWIKGDSGNPDNSDYQTGYPHIHTNLDSDGFRWTATNGSNTSDGITKERFLSSDWHQYTGSYTVESGVTSMELVVAPLWIGKNPTALNIDFPGFYIDEVSLKEVKTADSTPNTNHGAILNGPIYTAGPTSEGLGPDIIDGYSFTSWVNAGFDTVTANSLTTDGSENSYIRKQVVPEGGGKWVIHIKGTSTCNFQIKDYDISGTTLSVSSGDFDEVLTHHMLAGDEPIGVQVSSGTSGTITFEEFTVRRINNGDALSFDGTDDHIVLPNEILSAANIRADGVTYSAWVKTNNNTTEQRIFGQKPNTGYSDYASGGIGISSDGYAKMIAYDDPTAYKYSTGSTILQNDTWYLITGTYDPSDQKIRVYLNGNLEGTPTTITTFSRLVSNNVNRIGFNDHATNLYYLNGSIADVKLFDRALSATEILNLYEGSESKMSTGTSNKGLVGHWPLTTESLNSATTVSDTTPNNNDGTLTGGADVRNHGYSFDGTNDWLMMPAGGSASEFNTGADGEFSYSATIQATDYTAKQSVLSRRTGCNNDAHFNVYVQDNKLYLRFYSNLDTAYGSYDSDAILTDGETYHFTWTKKWGASDQALYINGTAVTVNGTSAAQGTTYDSLPILIGAQWSGDFCSTTNPPEFSDLRNFFGGTVADVRIYDRKLTATEAQTLYTGGEVASPLVYWPLSSGLSDISGSDRPLTVNGATLIGEAASFDGTDDTIDCGNNALVDNETNFTVEAWIRTSYDAPFPGELGIVRQGATSATGWTNAGWSLRLRDDKPTFAVRKKDDSGYWDLYTGNTIIDGEWHHIVGTFDTTIMRKYVDGTQTQSTSTGQSFLSSNTACNIGKINNYFNGEIKGVKVYNRTLTATEITSLYDQGHVKQKQASLGNLNKGLVGHWPLKSAYEKKGDNILTNPSFEAGDMTGWSNSSGDYSVVTDIVKDGSYALKGVHDGSPEKPLAGQTSVPVVIGKQYTVSAWVKSDLTAGTHYLTTEGAFSGTIGSSISGTTDWTFVQKTGTATTTTLNVYVYPHSYPNGTTWTDNISVKEANLTADTTPQSNHGAVYGSPTIGTDYTTFDGVNDYMSVPTNVLDSTQGTITVRVYPTATGSNDFVFMALGAGPNRFYIQWNSALAVTRGNPGVSITLTESTTLNTWYDVALSWSGTTMTGYLNGVKIDSATFTNPDTDPASFKIGDQSGNFITANIADVRIYDRVLSGNEIQMLYNQGQ